MKWIEILRKDDHALLQSEEHCDEMKKLWNSFADDEKPEWLTLEQIHEYREKMLKARRK